MPAYKDNKTGKWYAKFYYKDWQGVNRQKWKRGFANKKEALAFERDFLEKQSANPDMTFQALYEIYMEDMSGRLKESSIQHKKNIYETKILPYFGKMPINEIKATDIRRWQTLIMRDSHEYKDTYLKSINNQLSCIMNYAKRFYDLNTDPCGKAGSMGKSNAEEMEFWTLDEFLAFRDAIKDKPVSYMCFEILYWTGIREGELLALTAEDINLTEKSIRVNKTYSRSKGKDVITTPKTKKSKRTVPIPDFLFQEVKDYMDKQYMLDPKSRLFPFTKSFLAHEMKRGSKASGVKKIRIHDVRHSHASLLINEGYDALVIANRLGHEKVSTTLNTYSHMFPHKQKELVDNLQNLGEKAIPTPPSPDDIFSLDIFENTMEDTATANFPPTPVGPILKEKAPGKVIQMPIRNIV